MKRLTAILTVLSLFALSAPVAADEGIDTKKPNQPTINWTWGDGTSSTSTAKTNIKAVKGKNIKKATKECTKKPCDYIK